MRSNFIATLDPYDGLGIHEASAKFAGLNSETNTRDAYRIAANWQWQLSVDVAQLAVNKP